MATSLVPVVETAEDKEQLLGASEDSVEEFDSYFDDSYEDLRGRATADFIPLEKEEILLNKGEELGYG